MTVSMVDQFEKGKEMKESELGWMDELIWTWMD